MSLKKNILIACEYGYGRRHLYRLLQLHALYTNHGYNVFVYYHNLKELTNFNLEINDHIHIHATPLGNPQIQNLRLTNYGDIVTAFDVEQKDLLKSHFTAWMKILNKIKPNFIVCENAPLLNLIASSKIPTISVGDGISMLPFVDLKFPTLREDLSSDFNGEKAIHNINEALKKFDVLPLNKLGNIWNENSMLITHAPELDIYRHHRVPKQNYYSLTQAIIKNINNPEKKVFCYLYPDYQHFDTILIALVEHGFHGTALIPGASKKVTQFLDAHNIKIQQDFNFSQNNLEGDINLILHHGGVETAQYGLQNKIPQIIFPKSLNNFLIAGYLNNNKYGLKINNKWLGIQEVGHLISSYWAEPKINQNPGNTGNNKVGDFNEFKKRMLKFAQN